MGRGPFRLGTHDSQLSAALHENHFGIGRIIEKDGDDMPVLRSVIKVGILPEKDVIRLRRRSAQAFLSIQNGSTRRIALIVIPS